MNIQKISSASNFGRVTIANKEYEKILEPYRCELDKLTKGYDVYMGRLRSEDGEIISFFCTSSFVIESDNLIIDATNDGVSDGRTKERTPGRIPFRAWTTVRYCKYGNVLAL